MLILQLSAGIPPLKPIPIISYKYVFEQLKYFPFQRANFFMDDAGFSNAKSQE